MRPAHVMLCIKKQMQVLDNITSRLAAIESSHELVINSMNYFRSECKLQTEEVQSLAGCIDALEANLKTLNSHSEETLDRIAQHTNKTISLENGIQTLISAFDNDASVPSISFGPSLDKISAAVSKIHCDIIKVADSLISKPAASQIKSTVNSQPPTIDVPSSPISSPPTQGWRLIDTKIIWKNDWTTFDEKAKARKKLENRLTKQRKVKKKEARRRSNTAITPLITSKVQATSLDTNYTVPSVIKEVISPASETSAGTKTTINTQFNRNCSIRRTLRRQSRPVPSPPPPPPTSSDSRYPNFQRGETLVPSNVSRPPVSWCDPLTPPVVKLTQISAREGGRYLLGRFNDKQIYNLVRNYVAYLHDQPTSVTHDGMTCLSSKVRIGSEGLPTDVDTLKKLLVDYNSRYDFTPAETLADLESIRSRLCSERINYLQRSKENFNKFYSNKNF